MFPISGEIVDTSQLIFAPVLFVLLTVTEPFVPLVHSTAKLAEEIRTPPINKVTFDDDFPFLPSSEHTIHWPNELFHINLKILFILILLYY